MSISPERLANARRAAVPDRIADDHILTWGGEDIVKRVLESDDAFRSTQCHHDWQKIQSGHYCAKCKGIYNLWTSATPPSSPPELPEGVSCPDGYRKDMRDGGRTVIVSNFTPAELRAIALHMEWREAQALAAKALAEKAAEKCRDERAERKRAAFEKRRPKPRVRPGDYDKEFPGPPLVRLSREEISEIYPPKETTRGMGYE